MKIAESGSESGSGYISQMHGSADSDPDPHQNVLILNTGFYRDFLTPLGDLIVSHYK